MRWSPVDVLRHDLRLFDPQAACLVFDIGLVTESFLDIRLVISGARSSHDVYWLITPGICKLVRDHLVHRESPPLRKGCFGPFLCHTERNATPILNTVHPAV